MSLAVVAVVAVVGLQAPCGAAEADAAAVAAVTAATDEGDEVCSEVHGEGGCRGFMRLGAAALRQAPRVRHRDSFPDSHLSWMPEFLAAPGKDFPAVFRYSGSVADVSTGSSATVGESEATSGVAWDVLGRELRSFVESQLFRWGAAVIKGFPVHSAADFSKLMHATNLTLVDYVGGVTSRPVLAPKVTPASSEGPEVSMEPHGDDPYWVVPPTLLALYAQMPPAAGGQALLCDARQVLRSLQRDHPDVVEDFRRRSLRYDHFYPDSDGFNGEVIVSWQDAFAAGCGEGCNATTEAERKLRAAGHGFEWLPTGLRKWELANPVARHPVTGEETWFNEVTAMHCTVFDNHPAYRDLNRMPEARGEPCTMTGAMPYHTRYGDGGEIPPHVLHAIRRAQWENSVAFDYEAGDVVLVDNYLAMHGRFSFEPPRELYIVLAVGDEALRQGANTTMES